MVAIIKTGKQGVKTMKNADMPAMPIEINGFGQYAENKFGKIAVQKGVCYIKHGGFAVVETIKPTVFMVNFYEVS